MGGGHQEACLLRVRVSPRSKSEGIVGLRDGVLFVKVDAPPLHGQANERVCALLAEHLGLPASKVRIVAGHKARSKVIQVVGLNPQAVLACLGATKLADEAQPQARGSGGKGAQ
jgi:hypothetical protein